MVYKLGLLNQTHN